MTDKEYEALTALARGEQPNINPRVRVRLYQRGFIRWESFPKLAITEDGIKAIEKHAEYLVAKAARATPLTKAEHKRRYRAKHPAVDREYQHNYYERVTKPKRQSAR